MTAKVAPSNGTDVPCHLPSGLFLILGAFLLFFFFFPLYSEETLPADRCCTESRATDHSVCI